MKRFYIIIFIYSFFLILYITIIVIKLTVSHHWSSHQHSSGRASPFHFFLKKALLNRQLSFSCLISRSGSINNFLLWWNLTGKRIVCTGPYIKSKTITLTWLTPEICERHLLAPPHVQYLPFLFSSFIHRITRFLSFFLVKKKSISILFPKRNYWKCSYINKRKINEKSRMSSWQCRFQNKIH